MPSTTFTDNSTVIVASWLNDVNTVTYTLFGNGTSYTGNLTVGSSKFVVTAASGNLAIAGVITSTAGNSTTFLTGASATTGYQVLADLTNTSGHLVIGLEGSVASLVTGGIAYSTVVRGAGVVLSGDSGGSIGIRLSTGNAILFPNLGTTASAANAFLDSGNNNQLLYSTSLEELKSIRGNLTVDESRAVIFGADWFQYQSKIETDDQAKIFVGTGARAMFKLDKRFVHYTGDEPSGVQYERFVAPLAVIAKDHEARIRALEGA